MAADASGQGRTVSFGNGPAWTSGQVAGAASFAMPTSSTLTPLTVGPA